MAGTPFLKQSKSQLQVHIRAVAVDSSRVSFTEHALARMRKRHLSREIVLDVLRMGRLVRQPEYNRSKANLECRMERFAVGHHIGVAVALSDDDPDLLVITAMLIGN